VGTRAVLEAVVKRKIPSPRREYNPRTPIVQPIATKPTELSWLYTCKDTNLNQYDDRTSAYLHAECTIRPYTSEHLGRIT
jgi:hypothetical protein